jgi:hypothetical protein
MNYQPPVSELLRLGDVRGKIAWRNYLGIGLTAEHVAELIRMASDETFNEMDGESREVWAPVHAWRALGQLRPEAAVGPLLGLLHRIDDDDDDSAGEDLPEVLAMIGAPALGPTADYLANLNHGTYARVAASATLGKIGQRYPALRAEAVAGLTRALAMFDNDKQDDALNGFLVADLVELRAVEAAPLIERAFAAGAVDTMVMGDWDKVVAELGTERPAKPPALPSGPTSAPTPPAKGKKRSRSRKKK